METPVTRDQLIDAGITSPQSYRATCPCGTELSQGGIAWGTCQDCAAEVCGKCAASVSDEELPVFVCRKCAGKCPGCGGDIHVTVGFSEGGLSIGCDRIRRVDRGDGVPLRLFDPCGFAIQLTRAELLSAVYAQAGV